ncbi:polysaccharide deacetylase family protein [Brevibacterium litoralis]|uniref:polysaccharide deacetylase family protein n=1 Tax=Brevibacterium litoralis TaxID=3138935 RepID=UPI0032F04086
MSRACITFDFDAISLWIVRRMTTPGPVSRGEFGAYVIPRILRALADRKVTGTFFVPGHSVETYPDHARMIRDAGHELALHGYAHELVSDQSPAEEAASVDRAIEVFDRVLGVTPVGLRTPSWDFTESTIDIVRERGLIYDSSLMGQDYRPYFARQGDRIHADRPTEFGQVAEVVELPVTWTLDDYPQVEYLKTPAGVMPGPKTAKELFESFHDDWTYMRRIDPDGFHMVTMHPQVTGRGQRMLHFEDYLDRLVDEGAQFVTCEQIARDFLADPVPGADQAYRPQASA